MAALTASRRLVRVQPEPAVRLAGDVEVEVDPADDDVFVESYGPDRVVVHLADGRDVWAWPTDRGRPGSHGPRRIEVVVDGWRFELEVEDARLARLRERATRERAGATADGPLEIRAIIPGRVAAVSVTAGDTVSTGQTLLVVEAMKMQNELRAPRDGVVERIGAGAGETIELGDLLVVLS